MKIQRFSTKFIDSEDRIILMAEFEDGEACNLWLTQRLLNRLVASLCVLLEQHLGSVPLVEVRQEFAQQEARVSLKRQESVRFNAGAKCVLVRSIDLKSRRSDVSLHFMSVDNNLVAIMHLEFQQLRQWLNIAYDQYLRAEWSIAVWPAWIIEAKLVKTPTHVH